MTCWIALFRGINVGGRHSLPMAELRSLLEKEGATEVQTYIQSGNAVFRSSVTDPKRLCQRITAAVKAARGFEPHVIALKASDLAKAAKANPFPQADTVPTSLHLFFLAERPGKPDLAGIEAVKAKTEAFVLQGKVFYLYTPKGFGVSKLAARAERLLGVSATARNWRTVRALLSMAATHR